MADHDPLDDPFLERRLTSLAVLPVPQRPSVDELVRRGGATELDPGPERAIGGGGHRSRRSWLVAGAAAAVVLVVLAVGGIVRQGDAELASGTGSDLAGRIFWSQSVTEAGVPRTIPTATPGELPVSVVLIFDADGQTLRVSQGCDELEARYTIDGARLVVEPPTVTDRPCSPEVETQEAWLRSFVTSTPTIELDGDRLTLTSGTTVVELLDREVAEQDLPLVGTRWTLEAVVHGDEHVPAGATDAYLYLVDEGSSPYDVVGNDGCNDFSGTVEVEGDRFGAMEWVRELDRCDADDDPTVAESFGAFGSGATFEIRGSTLTITSGGQGLVFRGATIPEPVDLVPAPPDPGSGPIPSVPSIPGAASGTAAIEALVGPRWEVEAFVVGGERSLVAPAVLDDIAFVRFSVDQDRFTGVVRGNDGCHAFGGDAVPMNQTITFVNMSHLDGACPAGAAAGLVEAMATVLSGTAVYETDGTSLTILNAEGSLELRSVGEPAEEAGTRLAQGRWISAEVAADDRTITFDYGCEVAGAEQFDHAVVDRSWEAVTVTLVVRVPTDPNRAACTDDIRGSFTVVLDEPLDGRDVVQPPPTGG